MKIRLMICYVLSGGYSDYQKAKITLTGTRYERRKISTSAIRNARKDKEKKINREEKALLDKISPGMV